MNLDFDKDFQDFVTDNSRSAIKDIYDVIPTLSQEQQQVINLLSFYICKYDLKELQRYLDEYGKMVKKNKNLSFVRSFNFKNLLKAYSMEEYIRGIKVQTQNVQGRE